VTSYNHASTEDWNTTIINTILGTLVEETTPKQSDGGGGQPPFKYVVNSTIIQHAPVSSGGPTDPTLTGRRGMHAASGAFWSNEKDGMWSYKYSAAEKKGLDVVVGVIWIHVG
jgi:dynein light chain Tctex-type 1